ncbi:50S ribosomal protein L9 [Nocardioides yefusunii]|uniref:Large ribosomal subunit protein bL9 n=1 Tax=Nocardioides yefusunii TaxID=2500546 RepID=A0ABW1R1X2_9ACTN|nr:50S ribosomal protein L9 [Nocardioides yefusunii]
MKLILTQEVTGLGSAGDIVEVKNGYGRNYLIPRGDAMRWTKGGEKTVEQIQKARQARAARDAAHAAEIKTTVEAAKVVLKVRSGENGRLFGAVTVADIAGAISEAAGETIDKRTVVIGNPIKTTGTYTVSVKLHEDVTASVAVTVA